MTLNRRSALALMVGLAAVAATRPASAAAPNQDPRAGRRIPDHFGRDRIDDGRCAWAIGIAQVVGTDPERHRRQRRRIWDIDDKPPIFDQARERRHTLARIDAVTLVHNLAAGVVEPQLDPSKACRLRVGNPHTTTQGRDVAINSRQDDVIGQRVHDPCHR